VTYLPLFPYPSPSPPLLPFSLPLSYPSLSYPSLSLFSLPFPLSPSPTLPLSYPSLSLPLSYLMH